MELVLMKNLILSFFATILFTTFSYGTTIHVPEDFSTIQEGLNTANEGDTVLVASGTYGENIEWPNINGINLIGENQENTIIDGGGFGTVIRFSGAGNIDNTTRIERFTITNGYGSGLDGAGIELSFAADPRLSNLSIIDNYGEGIYCSESSPQIINTTITANSENRIRCIGWGASPDLIEVAIVENASSVYFAELISGKNRQIQKMILLK